MVYCFTQAFYRSALQEFEQFEQLRETEEQQDRNSQNGMNLAFKISKKNKRSIGVHVISCIAFMYFSAHLTLIAHVRKMEMK